MDKSWFVTGAAGFIGSHLSARLLQSGARVTGYDNFSTGNRDNTARVALKGDHRGGDAWQLVEGDIRDAAALTTAITDADVAVHLAAQVSVPKSLADPLYTDAVNVGGFLNTLTAAGKAGVRTFVYASSCAVYGDNPALPLNEDAAPRPTSPYAVSKLANDLYAATLASSFPEMTIVGLRLFNIFGPWQGSEGGYASVIPRWLGLCAQGDRPAIFGDGAATRDFCHVDDVATAIEAIGTSGRPPGHKVYNIGTGTATSLGQLFAVISSAVRRSGRTLDFETPHHAPERPGDILHSYADISRAATTIGYRPSVSLEDGIERMLTAQYGAAPGVGK